MTPPHKFDLWVFRGPRTEEDFASHLTPHYSEAWVEKEFGVSLNSELHPVAIDMKSNQLTMLPSEKCISEWTTKGEHVYDGAEIGLGKDDGYIFVSVDSVETGDIKIIGFVMSLGAIYYIHNKLVVRGKAPAVKKTINVESSSKKGQYWEVLVYEDDTLSCNCPAWRYKGRDCKHVRQVERDL